jgi:CRISPR/Cas system Type II protein with McrA/HNH and RuvC-like nuclease domain
MHIYQSSDDYLYNLETSSPQEARRLWKNSIKEKWEHKCAYCESTENLTLDHVIPQSKGGTDHITNVVCACEKCNRDKGHENWENWFFRQEFFTQEKHNAIMTWRTQLNKQELRVYRPRKNNASF